MDSAGIGLIMGRYKKIRDKGDISVVELMRVLKGYFLYRDFIKSYIYMII